MTFLRMLLLASVAALPVSAARAAPLPADCSKAAIPAGPAKGRMGGALFAPDDFHFQTVQESGINGTSYDANTLYLQGHDTAGGDMILSVSTISPRHKPIDGRSFHTVPGQVEVQPWRGLARPRRRAGRWNMKPRTSM